MRRFYVDRYLTITASFYVDRYLTITASYLFEKPIAFYLYSSFAPSDSYVL